MCNYAQKIVHHAQFFVHNIQKNMDFYHVSFKSWVLAHVFVQRESATGKVKDNKRRAMGHGSFQNVEWCN